MITFKNVVVFGLFVEGSVLGFGANGCTLVWVVLWLVKLALSL
jgi:hypothetical protein